MACPEPGIVNPPTDDDNELISAATLIAARSARSARLLADVESPHGRDRDEQEPALDRLAAALGRDFADRLVAALSKEALDRLEATLSREFTDRIAKLANERREVG
jgi:hypothetical protein